MSSPSPSTEDDVSPEPETPRQAAAANKGNKKSPSPNATPKAAATPRARLRSNTTKPPPTLLTDFLLGKQSSARLAADRHRRMSLEAVKAELRNEMKQSSVQRLQPPGGVRDRVKAWQKTNAAAIAKGDPDDAATEPTDIAFKGDAESVTEDDRIRIKMRQKKKPPKRPAANPSEETLTSQEDKKPDPPPPAKQPPKKRVVSDEHWRKNRKSVQRKASKKSSPKPISIPKDFTRLTTDPPVSNKVKAWASKVEIPEMPPPRSHRSSKSVGASSHPYDAESDLYSDMGETASFVASDLASRVTSKSADDGLRIKPVRRKRGDGDGIRVGTIKAALENDGIRVRPMSEVSSDTGTPRPGSVRLTRRRSRTAPSSRRQSPSQRAKSNGPASDLSRSEVTDDRTEIPTIEVIEEQSEVSRNTARRDDMIEVMEEPESVLDTPTRRPSASKSKRKPRPKSYHPGVTQTKEEESWTADEESHLDSSQLLQSDLSSSLLAKSVADLPGEIPWGNSAFTELDLPTGGGPPRSRPKRPKPETNNSFKGMPKVFKKVMEEGKKMIHEMNETPRNALPNNPPSIEKWLDNTVDPFVDKPKTEAASPEPQPALTEISHESNSMHKKSSQDLKKSRRSSTRVDRVEKEPSPDVEDTVQTPTPEKRKSTSDLQQLSPESEKKAKSGKGKSKASPAGLKRSSATRRNTSSPIKSTGKRPFLGMLKEAFQGESSSHTPTLKSYKSHEQRRYENEEGDIVEGAEPIYRYSSPRSGSPTEDRLMDDHDDYYDDGPEATTPRMAGPRLRPPTNGNYELSTIMSEGNSSAVDSDLTASDVSRSTVTQSTVLTRDSDLSRPKRKTSGGKGGAGLKRRLTRHSDLVSVLSLPSDANVPAGVKSRRSRPSLRKGRGGPGEVTTDDLLKEFADDENLYLRELKTLVDGVIPVLLSQVVDGEDATGLFGRRGPTCKADAISKSVVNMGVALEKLKNAHGIAPVSDMRRLAGWAHGVVPIYNKYLDSWRLGFQDLVVNLAPVAGRLDDGEEDSLLDAMPRNEDGDIVDAEGERVDVAHLLKRPLLRVKQMTRFIKCVDAVLKTNDTYDLLQDFEDLQEKARRRHREESARMIDEDAINTDTTRARDLRTLAPLGSVVIDPSRQVSAKDFFSLDLTHSSGQRLECQVELVHRDNERDSYDKGDLLIRETGDGRRSYLLLPPVPMELVSARTGDGNFDMVVMIRGTHNDRPWHELLTLYSDNEDQILDWLDILPVAPVPPREPEPSVVGEDDEPAPVDVPVGARGPYKFSPRTSWAEVPSPTSPITPLKRSLPSRYGSSRRGSYMPSTPPPASPESQTSEKTPTQDDYDERSRPLHESMRPDPATLRKSANTTPFRDDGAPPPPIHRTLSPSPSPQPGQKSPGLKPPVDLQQTNNRLKRRTSSPLKHEYLPSEGSSVSGTLTDGTGGTDQYDDDDDYETVSDSSDDDIESVDLPDTEVGFSIRDDSFEGDMAPPPMESVVSDCSLTPSNSASQAGLHGPKASHENSVLRFTASISRWSEKGAWKDICAPTCTILVTPGLIQAYPLKSSGADSQGNEKPALSLDLTPLVLIRQSTAVDLEIRSSVRPECQLAASHGGGNFRFRCHNSADCYNLYMAVHHARLNNQKFIELENEARFKSFGERKGPSNDDESSSHRRTWFGRKNSYRGSVRAPSHSHDGASTTPSSSLSASSFLKRLTGGGNLSFNIARSSVDRHSRAGSLYTAGSSSNGFSTPRSPSVSVENSGPSLATFGSENIKIRLHLLVSAAKWEDYGNCSLQIRRPPPGWHQALRADHGLEKRITVTTMPRKESDKPIIILDAVLGSGCFTPMGSRGIVCGVWEELKDGNGVAGVVPATGATGGNVKKWCFQCASVAEASWVLRLVHQEVLRA